MCTVMRRPLEPNITGLITIPYSVSISWIVTIIVYDAETYTVHYGTDKKTLVDNIVIMGNTDTGKTVYKY